MAHMFDTWTWVHLGLALVAFVGARLTTRWPAWRWYVILLSTYLSLRYFLWRGLYTLNLAQPFGAVLSILLLLAELYGFIAALLFYHQTLSPKEETAPDLGDGPFPTVDVMVTIYNESIDILYRTLVACQAMDYPAKRVIVCDDGQRQEVREVAEKLGCHYVRGPRNEDAKAGNLNHAMTRTDGELILTLDIDHIPVRSFLQETVGFFRDPTVALVQTAHHFYNPDIFQRNLRVEEVASNEQDMFFHVVQPGRNRWNASFYCGSGAVLRRSALEAIGGFRTETVTEDIHTSIMLHARGYRSHYVNKDLAAGLAPEDFVSYLKQRKRWARGCFQVFLRANPLLVRGLRPSQRINYFASIFYFLHGLPRLVFLLAPLMYLLFRQYPLRAEIPDLIGFYFPHLIAFLSVLPAITRVFRKAFWADIYETVMCLPLSLTVFEVMFRPGERSFAVTPKGLQFSANEIRFGMVWWLIGIGVLTVIGLWNGAFRLMMDQWDPPALIINLLWATYNFVILISAILAAYERPQLRTMPRLARRLPCEVKLPDGTRIDTHTRDLSETGCSLDLHGIYGLTRKVELVIHGDGEQTRLRGELTRFDRRRGPQPSVGIRFRDFTEEQHRSIIRQMFSAPDTWAGAHDRVEAGAFLSLGRIATSALRARTAPVSMQRRSLRRGIEEECEVRIDGRTMVGRLRDVSREGLAVEVPGPLPESPGVLVVRLAGPGGAHLEIACHAVYSRRAGRWMKLGLRVDDPGQIAAWISSLSS